MRTILGVELEHGQKFHCGDAELLEIRDLLNQAGVRSPSLLADSGIRMTSESADVHLINDGTGRRQLQRAVSLPIVSAWIDDNTFHCGRGVVALSPGGLAVVVPRNDDAATVGIQQNLRRIEPKSARGGRRPIDSVAVNLSWPHAGYKRVPVVVSAARCWIDPNQTGRTGVMLLVEEQEFDARRSPREKTEVDAAIGDGCAKRRASASLAGIHR